MIEYFMSLVTTGLFPKMLIDKQDTSGGHEMEYAIYYSSKIKDLLNEDNSTIDKVRKILQLLYLTLFTKYPCICTSGRKDAVVNLVMAIFLKHWLEYDPEVRQSIRRFSEQKYLQKKYSGATIPTNNSLDNYDYDNIAALEKTIRRSWQILEKITELHIEDVKEREITYKPLPRMKAKRTGRQLDPIMLNFLSYYADGKLQLLDLLARREKFMEITSDKGSYASLINAFRAYDEIYAGAKCLDDRQYVTTCIQLHQLERTYRFHLSAAIAKYMVEHNIPIDTTFPLKASQFWASYIISSGEKKHVCYQYDILHYDWEIHQLFEEPAFSPVDENAYKVLRETVDELLIHINTIIFGSLLPFNRRSENKNAYLPILDTIPHWTDKDFCEAAAFFRNKYPIIETYNSIDFGEDPSKQKIYGAYTQKVLMDLAAPERFKHMREEMKHRKRNKA